MARQGSSDSSSDEQPTGNDDAVLAPRAAAKRSYECSFCKRGFTNAQALGGHMNIHRRDRAKSSSAKASASSAAIDPAGLLFSSSSSSGNYYNSSDYVGPIFTTTHHQQPSPSVWDAHRDRDQRHVFFQQPAWRGYGNIINYNIGPPSQRSSSHVDGYNNLVVPPAAAPRSAEEARWGANLSLRVGSGQRQREDDVEDDDEEEEDVLSNGRPIWNPSSSSSNDHDHLDLELRLGP